MSCLWLLVILACLFQTILSHSEMPKLLVISFDGFRWDYLDLARNAGRSTKNFDKLISSGVTIESGGMKNVFTTKTFPNHYSLVTGLYEDHHGIVSNHFYDPVFHEAFSIGQPGFLDLKWWNGTEEGKPVEPIWITNQKVKHSVVGMPRSSGAFFWPGSEVKGLQPDHYEQYNKSLDFALRIDTTVRWFTDHEHPINLGFIYFHEPDSTGHKYGPDAQELFDEVQKLDELVGHLIEKLEEHRLYDALNLIITSDHGMTKMLDKLFLEDYVNVSLFMLYGESPDWEIYPKEDKDLGIIYNKLKNVTNLFVYKREEIPAEYHYTQNRRIPPILVSSTEGFQICVTRQQGCSEGGDHGYNNSLSSMHPIFIAHGPAFRSKYKSRQFNSVDLYSLMCEILDIPPRPNDGSMDVVQHMLRGDEEEEDHTTLITMVAAIGGVSLMGFICCVGAIRSFVVFDRKRFTSWTKIDTNGIGLQKSQRPLLVSEEEEEFA